MNRGRRFIKEEKGRIFKKTLYFALAIFAIVLITFVITFVIYNNKLKKSISKSLQSQEIADLVPNYNDIYETESANLDIGKTIENIIEETEAKLANDNNYEQDKNDNNINYNNYNIEDVQETSIISENTTEYTQEEIKDPEFIMPVEGEIIRDFAKDNLIYSNTLDEWITHLGIDIKAERTEIVKASESGKIVSIKNDPRYGLSIIIEHVNGYKTVYSNLLSTEFVKEGEEVEKGQTIGTVGNSAPFEISDEPHLHFEILKDNVNVDPKLYI